MFWMVWGFYINVWGFFVLVAGMMLDLCIHVDSFGRLGPKYIPSEAVNYNVV